MGQTALRTPSFVQFLYFDDLQAFFQLEVHDIKIDLFLGDFERVRLIQKLEILVSFCIFSTCNNIRTDEKKFEPEVKMGNMKMGLFFRNFCSL